MADKHVVVGAGPVGRAVADALREQQAEVVLASRSGTGPEVGGATRAAVDAADGEALTQLAEGAVALYNCMNPPAYTTWSQDWPPVAAALLTAAGRSGAVLVTACNLYPYGPVRDGVMREGMPDAAPGKKGRIRARMTADAFAAHAAGRIRAVEVRGSDYMGAGPGDYAHVPRVVEAALAGRTVRMIGRVDQPHTWTDVADMGRALATVATREEAWGRVWHAPSNPPRTQAEAVADVCRSVGRQPGKVRAYPPGLLTAMGAVVPLLRELKETEYQFTGPFVMESGAITAAFGLQPGPWEEICRRTATGSGG
jgi:nucleoside-diphosphate-sugar epimerase